MNSATIGAIYLGAGTAILMFVVVFIYVWLTKVRPELKIKRELKNQSETTEDYSMADGGKDAAERALERVQKYQEAQQKRGTPTGLCDHHGAEICVGDYLRKPVDCNEDFHGKWAIYEVRQQGLTPIISYVRSATGEKLPRGYLAAPLCDEYDRKMFVFARNSLDLRPSDSIVIVEKDYGTR